jgi:acetylornithine aminotransferase
VRHVPYGDLAALDAAVDADTAAVFLEPILGEAGAVTPPAGYLAGAREITAARGALLVLDEVQTGIGRTGEWFAFQRADGADARSAGAPRWVPDVITLAKGLGGGLPIGACIGVGAAGELFEPGQHGTTFGGNPVSCAAALAVLRTIGEENLLEQVRKVGAQIAGGVQALGHPLVRRVDGAGLLLGIELTEPVSSPVALAARDGGFLVNNPVPDRVRLVPPLILSSAQAAEFLAALPSFLDAGSIGARA